MTETTHEALVRQTGAAEELLDYFQGSRADIEAKVAAKEAQVDAFLTNAATAIGAPRKLKFDHTVLHSKSSLAIPDDPLDNSRTKWASLAGFTVPSSAFFYTDARRAFVRNARALIYAPATGDPAFSTDYCRTLIHMCVANTAATHEQIEQYFADNPALPSPIIAAAYANNVDANEVPIARVAAHPYSGLWVRFVNVIASEAITAGRATAQTAPQPIATHGGNSIFAVEEVALYNL